MLDLMLLSLYNKTVLVLMGQLVRTKLLVVWTDRPLTTLSLLGTTLPVTTLLIVSLVPLIELKSVNRICVMGGPGSSPIAILAAMLSTFLDLANSVSRLKLGELSVLDFSASVLLLSARILTPSRPRMARLHPR